MKNCSMKTGQSRKSEIMSLLSSFAPFAKSILMLVPFSLLITPLKAGAQFANGADVSWLHQMEDYGYVFKDNYGVRRNCLDILKEKGINALRFRVWVNPPGGYCNKRDVAYMAHRADSMGFKVMIDFHCSDTWADPSHQTKPVAWQNDSLPKLLTDLYNHVYNVLDTLKSIGVVPAWVQIGNETNDGMLWPDGRASTHMANFAKMIDTGYAAAKAVDSSIQVIVHLSNGHDDAMYRWIFDGLKSYGARWDIIGMSVYPYWANLPWAEDDSLAQITMKDMIARYNKKVMVVEAGYFYYDPIDANQYLLDLIAKTKEAGGLGVFYWEPECYNWQGYQLGAWDPKTEEPTVALDAFLGKSATPVKQPKSIKGYGFYIYPNPFNPNTTIEYDLPTPSVLSIVIYNVMGERVAQLVSGYQNEGKHNVVWTPGHLASGVYFCRFASENFLSTRKIILLK